jgi:hypothetical protein
MGDPALEQADGIVHLERMSAGAAEVGRFAVRLGHLARR